jgi:hypothetical protein
VAGTYGFSGSGTLLSPAAEPSASLIATVGLLTFDGEAQWRTTHQTLTIHGQVTQPSMTGFYTVQADCTFTLAFEEDTPPVDVGVFVHDRHEGFFMATVEGVIVTFTMKRIAK